MDSKENIKKEINNFCTEISSSKYTGYVNTPVVIAIYLGNESYDRVNASLKDAFTTSFSIQPSLYEIQIELTTDKTEIVEMFKNAITTVSNQGKSYNDIRISFISMMDDSFYSENSLKIVDELNEAFEELLYLGLDLGNKAFYGLFDQNKMKENYKYAFEFVEKGKNIWKNIYHIEIPFVEKNITRQTQLIALNVIRDNYTMVQTSDSGYRWTSLYLHYLKISEFITCRLLREIYGMQIDGKHVDSNTWSISVNDVLDDLFKDIIKINSYNSYMFVPLNYQQPEVVKSKGFSFFGRRNQDVTPTYNKILKDEDVIKNLVLQLYADISLDDKKYSDIIEKIISSSTSIDPNSSLIGNQIIDVLKDRINDIENKLVQLNKNNISDSNIQDVNRYLKSEYTYYQQIYALNKEKEIIKQIIEKISNDIELKQIINDIVDKNRNYANLLDELTLIEYGGTLESLNVQNLPLFKVNQSVEEILKNIDKNFVNNIINNNQSLNERLQLFLNHTILNEVAHKHKLGEIHNEFSDIQAIVSYLLLTPNLSHNQDINNIISNHENLLKDTNDIYRDNSFFLISSRKYNSDRYIVRYKRGE